MSDSDSSLSSAESDESSSLSELSSSDCELSPVIPPTNLLRSPPAIKVTDAWSPPRASTSNLLLALAPPPRAASKGVVYTEVLPSTEGAVGATSGKRLEVLQAVRNGGKGGKGGGGKGGGGKGKGVGVRKKPAAKKGKTTLPQKKARTQSNASREDWDDDEEEQDYSDEDMDDYYFDHVDASPPKRAPEPVVYKKKREEVVKKVVQAVKQLTARKQPKKQPVRVVLPAPSNHPPAASPSISLGALPPLPNPSDPTAAPTVDPSPRPLYGLTDPSPFIPGPADILVSNLPPLPSLSTNANATASGSSSILAAPGSSFPPLPGQAFVPGQPGVPGVPGVPVKRGRGRPPKNGICAQRPRKPKPEALLGQAAPPVVKKPPKPKVPKPKPAPPLPAQPLAPVDPSLPPLPSSVVTHDGIPLDPSLPAANPTQPAFPYPVYPEPPSAAKLVAAAAAPGANSTGAPGAPGAPVASADGLLVKPPYTYASLIAQAVSSVETRKLTLNGIYDWITARWPYFSDNNNGWQVRRFSRSSTLRSSLISLLASQNSIRHNLTISRGFLKIPRRTDEPGKGAFWAIDPTQIRNFDGLHFRKKTPKGLPGAPRPPKLVQQPKPGPSLVPKAALVTQGSAVAGPSKPVARPPVSTAPSLSTPLPIIIAPIPASYVRPAPPPSANPPDDLTASLLKDPPIVLHEGKLILNPAIFAHLQKTQLDNLQILPASQALQILQAFVVQHFKDKMRKMAAEKEKAANVGGGPTSGTPGTAVGTSNGVGTSATAGSATPSGATTASAGAGTPSTVTSAPPVASSALKPPSVASTPGLIAGPPVAASTTPKVVAPVVAPKPVAAAPALTNGGASSGVGKRKLEEEEEDIEVSAPKMVKLEKEGGATVA